MINDFTPTVNTYYVFYQDSLKSVYAFSNVSGPNIYLSIDDAFYYNTYLTFESFNTELINAGAEPWEIDPFAE